MESKYNCHALSNEELREVCVIGLTRGELWLPCVRSEVIEGQHYWRDTEDQAPTKHGPFASERAALLDAIETEGVENPEAWGIVMSRTSAGPGAPKYLDYVNGLPLQDALWWFIENASDDLESRTEIFFALRERVRAQVALEGSSVEAAGKANGLQDSVDRTLMVTIPIKTEMRATPQELADIVEKLIDIGVADAHSTLEDKEVDHKDARLATGIDFGKIQVVETIATKRAESVSVDPAPGF
ncbi:hypothetical protein [Ralstonia sp. ASV6]|uniref:hypothetical protein n=1 Tax=Ralstonia sp. ASV6 TaxID=2795124 RepID=UPI0018EC1C77|nr:hypothetical protein [Ralstonia sp. ASV6]